MITRFAIDDRRSYGRRVMNADPQSPGDVPEVDPDILLHFKSTSNVIHFQPDPYHLKDIVADLKVFREVASRNKVPDDLAHLVVKAIVDGLHRLDALPREEPFWDDTNRRPTLGKLREFCTHLVQV